tara:strand:- start:24 stop:185 length:162 start_codon:yes stop_codon:yes gene_type:complete
MLKSPLLKKYCGGAARVSQGPAACWRGYQRTPNTTEGEPGSCQNKDASKRPKK